MLGLPPVNLPPINKIFLVKEILNHHKIGISFSFHYFNFFMNV